ncbi:hypothetical protein B0H19DRAFT_1265188 [Mycena capillaripes]|nr:hypothetical protein B0H19DRAFT_1265188 [Mycena capillaripes]
MEDKLATYLASSEFKKNVVSKIRAVFLDANLLSRLMRHLRLNPGAYRIPQEFRSEITGTTFNSAVSIVATGARSEIKRKMTTGWKAKTPIYDLVKIITWNSSQEMTDRIWGRFAWALALVDYTESAAPADLFWDDINTKLAEHREKTAEIPLEGRAAYESLYDLLLSLNIHCTEVLGRTSKFEEALKLHLRMFSRSNHHDQTAPAHVLAPPAPSPTPQPTSGGWQPSTDLTSAHHLRLESLLDSALAALTLILDTATPIASPTFTDHTTEVLRALCRRILVASPRQGTMTVPTDTTPTPIPTLTPAKIATYAEIVTDTATDRAETPTEAKPIIADQCQSRPTAKFRLKADLIFRLDLEKPGPSTQPHPTALFIALMKSPDVAPSGKTPREVACRLKIEPTVMVEPAQLHGVNFTINI